MLQCSKNRLTGFARVPRVRRMTNPTSQMNPFMNLGSFDPMGYWAAAQQQFTKLAADAQGRAASFAEQCAAMESQLVVRTQQAIATFAQMTSDALGYVTQLSAEARKLAVVATKPAA